ncbi:helix-turn-helix domain-containing protein [Sphingomonas panacisoli]|uniref:helix-turn-helix domain-containing protein n=1 Tax=Sphingomonas panacisoli TaxID=1813879 RepID=UPI001646CFBA|nr:helix-turn-helix domain-containing protein [Sphingomonas panacisoli]
MTALLKPDEAAARLMVSARTLRDLKRRGLIRYIALTDRLIAYRAEDCDEYLEARLRQDEPPCPSTDRPKAISGTTTSGSKVLAITEALAARQNATRSGISPKSGGRQR